MERLLENAFWEHVADYEKDMMDRTDNSLQRADLRPPELEDIAAALRNGMSNAFHELEVDISACPCLTRHPYNLAGAGLCGNTAVISLGSYDRFMPTPQLDTAFWNLREKLQIYFYDSFTIGAGYAARRPETQMPYNGHLIVNAMYNEPNFTNASRIVYADEITGQSRIETLTSPDHMTCSLMGIFFVSDGMEGDVIRVRAKGRKCNVDITTLMQDALFRHYYSEQPEEQRIVVLGGVLKVRNGRVAQNVMPQEYPSRVSSPNDLAGWLQCHEMDLKSDLIAVGTIDNYPPKFYTPQEQRYGYNLPFRSHNFYSFSDYGAGGQFIGDTTKDMTEYEVYLNVARKLLYAL